MHALFLPITLHVLQDLEKKLKMAKNHESNFWVKMDSERPLLGV